MRNQIRTTTLGTVVWNLRKHSTQYGTGTWLPCSKWPGRQNGDAFSVAWPEGYSPHPATGSRQGKSQVNISENADMKKINLMCTPPPRREGTEGGGCGVAQIVARQVAVRQARVRISARHPRAQAMRKTRGYSTSSIYKHFKSAQLM